MNITLIYPLLSRCRSKIDENKQYWPPLGLAYIAAVLENKGHNVQIIDRDAILRKSEMSFDKTDTVTLGMIRDFSSGVIGISATTPNMSDVQHISQYIKNNYSKAVIVAGGPHPSGEPVLTLKESPFVDMVAIGEGEFTMCDIASGLDPKKISGIAYRNKEGIITNARREPVMNLDDLPHPARHLLDMKFYTRPSRFTSRNLSLRTTSIFTARGCPYRCAFCAGPLVFNGKVRFHSVERVMNEIEELISKYSVEALYFAEDMFLSSKARAEEMLEAFIDRKINKRIKWMAQAKANIITSELLELMKEAGCVGIEYGFESGSQRVLDLMNKKLKVEESLRAAALTNKARLRFQANIIVGYPGEKEEDFRETIKFMQRIKPSMIGFNLFMPLPGTPSYEKLKADGKELPKWDDIGDPEAPHTNFADMPSEVFEKLYLETRLKVILPINLGSFIKDNIRNPPRLVKVAFTQFGGVLAKTMRSFRRLKLMKKKFVPNTKKVLFLSYNGLLEPILPSQAIPYLEELAKLGFEFTLLTYEKKKDIERLGKKKLETKRLELKNRGIDWRYLLYHKNPPILSTVFDLLAGALCVLHIARKKKIDIVHIRGITPGMIIILVSKILKVKVLFDMRGLLAEEYVGGGLWKEDGVQFKIVKNMEERMLKISDAVTVLTNKHLELNKALKCIKGREIVIDVIPCCVDMERFHYNSDASRELRKKFNLENKTILMYPGKIGTFYLMKEMLDFYREMLKWVDDTVFVILTNDSAGGISDDAGKRGIPDGKIKIIRGVDFADMPRHIGMADIGIFFINPYKKIGSSPIKMGEFLATGVPVVINSGIGDTDELVTKNRVGVVVRNFNVADYEKAVREMTILKREGEELSRRCRQTAAENLSLQDAVKKYADIYNAMLKASI